MPKKVVPDGPGRRVPIMGRTTADLRRKLEEAAAASGRSLALELENRLEKTFDTDNLITRVYRLGSEEKLTRILLDAIRDTMEDYHDLNDDQRKTLISALLISLGENIADRPAVQVLLSADEAFGKESSWHRNASIAADRYDVVVQKVPHHGAKPKNAPPEQHSRTPERSKAR